MKKKNENKQLVIYQAPSGAIELRGDFERETIWANLNQIADLFGVQKAAVSKHIKNIFDTRELNSKTTVSKMETVQKEGKRSVSRSIEMYNLDMIIAVGYRINSKNATQFRIWATKVLHEFLTKGYTINRKRIAKNYKTFMKSVSDIQALLPEHITLDPKAVLGLVKEFSSTWMSLDAYDKDALTAIGTTKKSITLSGKELTEAILNLRNELTRKAKAKKFRNISPPTLTALTLLIAESDPKKKEQMVALVTQLLK